MKTRVKVASKYKGVARGALRCALKSYNPGLLKGVNLENLQLRNKYLQSWLFVSAAKIPAR